MAAYPKYSLTVVRHAVFGYRLYDVDLVYQCPCCHDTTRRHYPNVSRATAERIAARADNRRFYVVSPGYLDSYLRLRDDPDGCYAPEGYWLVAPIGRLELEDLLMAQKKAKTRKESLTLKLARWFVVDYLGREWTDADYHGSAMKHAKLMLADYDYQDIVGCLAAARDGSLGDLGGLEITALTGITKFEPPLINRWLDYTHNPPPIWKTDEYNLWARRTGKDELPTTLSEAPSDGVLVWPPGVRPETDAPQAGPD